jgi:glycosyltransferase involved in cell wall biosynthesis
MATCGTSNVTGDAIVAKKVAIITRTKNRPMLLQRAIESVLNQTFTDWTHVIVNDGGDVNAIDRLVAQFKTRYQGRLQLIHNLQSNGMEAASNTGIRATDSELLVIHDDDDTWDPLFLYEMVTRLNDERSLNPNVKGIACYSTVITEEIHGNAIVERDRHSFNDWLSSITLWRMLASNFLPPISFVFERAAAEALGLFDEKLEVLGDWDFHIRFLLHHDIALLPAPLARYHHRKTQDGVYANSVHVRENKHELTRARYVNAKLRGEIAQGRIGIGSLTNLAFQLDGLRGDVASGLRSEVGGVWGPLRSLRKRLRRIEVALGVGIALQAVAIVLLMLK